MFLLLLPAPSGILQGVSRTCVEHHSVWVSSLPPAGEDRWIRTINFIYVSYIILHTVGCTVLYSIGLKLMYMCFQGKKSFYVHFLKSECNVAIMGRAGSGAQLLSVINYINCPSLVGISSLPLALCCFSLHSNSCANRFLFKNGNCKTMQIH